VNDIVRAVQDPPPADDGVDVSLELCLASESYGEYVLRCACAGVEPLFTREEFEAGCRGIIPAR
jgi:hypothetical protein